jgi:hypothetical protein
LKGFFPQTIIRNMKEMVEFKTRTDLGNVRKAFCLIYPKVENFMQKRVALCIETTSVRNTNFTSLGSKGLI